MSSKSDYEDTIFFVSVLAAVVVAIAAVALLVAGGRLASAVGGFDLPIAGFFGLLAWAYSNR